MYRSETTVADESTLQHECEVRYRGTRWGTKCAKTAQILLQVAPATTTAP